MIGDLQSSTQTRKMSKNLKEHRKNPKRNKKDDRGIVIRNKARLVAQGYTQEEGNDYDEFFASVTRIEAIRLFLAYASFKDFVVYQMYVNSAFHYGKIEEEVYVCQPLGFEDLDFPDRVYKVEKSLYGLYQAPRAWYETLSTYLLDNGFQRGKLTRPYSSKAYTDSDYAGASLDRKSTTGGCQIFGCRLISWQCKKQTVVANSTTKAEYVAASSCCGQVLWIQNQLLDYRYALTINPTIYISCIEQFWSTVMAKTINGEEQLHALVDGKKIIITESSIRRDLQLADEEGVDCLPNSTTLKILH
ncbi:putative ribonuclease H-like domain-containing protein [Tanacetum coccineum]